MVWAGSMKVPPGIVRLWFHYHPYTWRGKAEWELCVNRASWRIGDFGARPQLACVNSIWREPEDWMPMETSSCWNSRHCSPLANPTGNLKAIPLIPSLQADFPGTGAVWERLEDLLGQMEDTQHPPHWDLTLAW